MKDYKMKILDVVVIFREIDEHYLIDLKKSIPNYAKLILVMTKKSDKDVLTILENKENYSYSILEYTETFSFAYARNQALKLSTNKFILSLDADERLLQHQHEQLRLHILEYDKLENFGGAMFYNFSVKTISQNKYGLYDTEIMPQCKLFITGSFWQGDIHENISIPKDKIIYSTPLIIHHIGYEVTKERMAQKIEEYQHIALYEQSKKISKVQKDYLTANDLLQNIKKQLINKELA
jgi:glycosyltransferase involved in cell wall biosynthesis